MQEIGIDISRQQPKLLSEERIREADRVISMGCGVQESCPIALGKAIDEDWALDDPYGQPQEKMRQIRDEIRRWVELLSQQLGS